MAVKNPTTIVVMFSQIHKIKVYFCEFSNLPMQADTVKN